MPAVRALAMRLFVCFFTLATVVPPARAQTLPPIAAATLRNGATVAAIAAPDSPWAVVLIAARVPDRALSPDERSMLSALAQALAQGRSVAQPGGLDLAGIGGMAKASVDADTLTVLLGAPADRLDDLLRAADARLKARRGLLPAQGATPLVAPHARALSAEAVALVAPSHPDGLAVSASAVSPVEPRALRELAERVLAGANVRIVVVGPRGAPELLQTAERALQGPLPPGTPSAAAPHALAPGTALVEREDGADAATASRLWFFCADDDAHAKAAAHAAVLADLVGGALEWTEDVVAIVVDVSAPRASAAPRAEGRAIETLAKLAVTAPPDEMLAQAKARVRAARLSQWKDPEALALAVARGKDAGALSSGLAALDATMPSDVQAIARKCAVGPRVVRRTLGAAR